MARLDIPIHKDQEKPTTFSAGSVCFVLDCFSHASATGFQCLEVPNVKVVNYICHYCFCVADSVYYDESTN